MKEIVLLVNLTRDLLADSSLRLTFTKKDGLFSTLLNTIYGRFVDEA